MSRGQRSSGGQLTTPRRRYDRALRDAQALQTRERILEALVRTMARGVAEISVPAVAREAGVSIPTIYRHFGSKSGLVQALSPYVASRTGLQPDRLPENLDELEFLARESFRRLGRIDPTLRAAMASELGNRMRRTHMPERRAWHRDAIAAIAPGLSPEELDRLADLSVILLSSASIRAFKDYLGASTDQASDRLIWALRTLVRSSTAGPRPQEEREAREE
jgi:AcrR family transcriptional regulator